MNTDNQSNQRDRLPRAANVHRRHRHDEHHHNLADNQRTDHITHDREFQCRTKRGGLRTSAAVHDLGELEGIGTKGQVDDDRGERGHHTPHEVPTAVFSESEWLNDASANGQKNRACNRADGPRPHDRRNRRTSQWIPGRCPPPRIEPSLSPLLPKPKIHMPTNNTRNDEFRTP